MKTKKNITFIGMTAVGKSTDGKLLASKIGFNFLDTDDLIQSKEQKPLSRIISEKGLDRFLQIEENHIISIACSNYVIATGGSVVYSQKAMKHLCKTSTIIYLSIDLDTLLTRLCNITSRGVAISPEKSIEDLYKERTPLYDIYYDIKIECGSMTVEQVVNKAVQSLS